MNTIPENLVIFIKDILCQLEGKLPPEIFYKIADTIVKNVQYQYLRDHGYGKKEEIIQSLQNELAPLQQILSGQQSLSETLQQLGSDQTKSRSDQESLRQNLQSWQRHLNKPTKKIIRIV